jgi:hypothetical protein
MSLLTITPQHHWGQYHRMSELVGHRSVGTGMDLPVSHAASIKEARSRRLC